MVATIQQILKFKGFLVFWLWMGIAHANSNIPSQTVILVDKKTHTLRVAQYTDAEYKTLKTYHVVIGKVAGDKTDQGDLKTPEGIYDFNARLTPPTLKQKFGVMAFYMDYPNNYDRIAGQTGSDIMLHATNTPERLNKDFDSEGCIVLKDEEITEVMPYIRVGLTPILVFADLTSDYLKPAADTRLTQFFKTWIESWENKNLDDYIDHYHSAFRTEGKNLAAWKAHKANLNKNYKKIEVAPTNIQYFRHPKYASVRFTQNYKSWLANGVAGHQSIGTKTILVGEEDGKLKIITEDYSNLRW